ncbi:MAG: hypothetical protein ABIZ49_07980, partial [Opitutaceae bacterium]
GQPDTPQLDRCFSKTIELLKKYAVNTVDELAQKLVTENPPNAVDLIREAKIAIMTLFHRIEWQGIAAAYPNYKSFFETLFAGSSLPLDATMAASRCRVLTFNYDRLFERAFFLWANGLEPWNHKVETPYSFLNSGLDDPLREIRIRPDRFSFLKLHGGVGQAYRDNDLEMNRPPITSYDWQRFNQPSLPPLDDENYFPPPENSPTIIFPCEKARSAGSFKKYWERMKENAGAFCRSAHEIHIMGYSLPSLDLPHLKPWLQAAKACERIVLRNRPSEKSRLEELMEIVKWETDAPWSVEFKAEDFFCVSRNAVS